MNPLIEHCFTDFQDYDQRGLSLLMSYIDCNCGEAMETMGLVKALGMRLAHET